MLIRLYNHNFDLGLHRSPLRPRDLLPLHAVLLGHHPAEEKHHQSVRVSTYMGGNLALVEDGLKVSSGSPLNSN